MKKKNKINIELKLKIAYGDYINTKDSNSATKDYNEINSSKY